MLVEAFSGGGTVCRRLAKWKRAHSSLESVDERSRASGCRIHGWLLILPSPFCGLMTLQGSCNMPDRLRSSGMACDSDVMFPSFVPFVEVSVLLDRVSFDPAHTEIIQG